VALYKLVPLHVRPPARRRVVSMVQPVAGAAAIALGVRRRAAAGLPAAEHAAQLLVARAAAAGAGRAARREGAYEGELQQAGEHSPRVWRLRGGRLGGAGCGCPCRREERRLDSAAREGWMRTVARARARRCRGRRTQMKASPSARPYADHSALFRVEAAASGANSSSDRRAATTRAMEDSGAA